MTAQKTRALLSRLEKLAETAAPRRRPLSQYAHDPAGYARDVLGVRWWAKQIEIAESLLKPPYKTLVLAGHSVGKTHTAAGITNWFYDTRDPSAAITTAPTSRDVRDLLWKEIRLQRGSRGGFSGTEAPLLKSSPDHYAKGFTAAKGESFQGRHDTDMLFVFDEAVGIKPIFWQTTKSMFSPRLGHAWLAICNPTDTTSQAYIEDAGGGWNVIRMSALDHPNIAAELRGERPPYPSAVSLAQLDAGLSEHSFPVTDAERKATDIEWPPGSGKYLRPGPIAEARWLGRWPSAGTYGVWSDALWQACFTNLPIPRTEPAQIGCDVARYGDDMTEIHVRRGPASLSHEAYNGWSIVQTAARLRQLVHQHCEQFRAEHPTRTVDKTEVVLKIDDDGVGGGLVDLLRADGYTVIPINAGTPASKALDYPNKRSELWFDSAERARLGLMSLTRLPAGTINELRRQAMAPVWSLDAAGRRVVEKKEDTKKKLTRSPDGLDALNLAYYDGHGFTLAAQPKFEPRNLAPDADQQKPRRRLFG